MSSHFLHHPADRTHWPALSLAVALTAGLWWVLQDFSSWRAFGTGGTPPTWAGYWRITKLRWKVFWANDDLLDTSKIPQTDTLSFLGEIPTRRGGRPRIYPRPLPQRQFPEALAANLKERLMTLMKRIHSDHPNDLVLDLSQNEGRTTDAIYAKEERVRPSAKPSASKIRYEIAHVHPSDNSLHVILSAADCKKIIEAEWGQRFILSFVPQNMIWVYAPRDADELELIEKICRAAVTWVLA